MAGRENDRCVALTGTDAEQSFLYPVARSLLYEPGVKLNYAHSRFPSEFKAGKAQQEIPTWQLSRHGGLCMKGIESGVKLCNQVEEIRLLLQER